MCRTISQMLCAPARGCAAACSAVMPASDDFSDGPCHVSPLWIRFNSSTIRLISDMSNLSFRSLLCRKAEQVGHFHKEHPGVAAQTGLVGTGERTVAVAVQVVVVADIESRAGTWFPAV